MSGRPRMFRGIGVSPGIAVGRVFLLDRRAVRVPRYHIVADQATYEIQRLDNGISKSVAQLEAIRARFVGPGMDHQAILEAHEMMLRDKALLDEAVALIRDELINAEWAVSRVLARIRGLLERVSDAYLRERLGDIDSVAERILRNLVGQVPDLGDLDRLEDGTVVVAHELGPVDTAILSRQRVTAFVTEVGGQTSHASIIARALEVPAVVGTHGILDVAGSGDLILVDGEAGVVRLRPSAEQIDRGRRRSEHLRRQSLELIEAQALPATTLDGHSLVIAGNIELPAEVATVLARGGEAIGLYRTEFMFLGRPDPPNEEEHYRAYTRIFDEMGDREVTVRTLDLGGEKLFSAMAREVEPNPALGLRAIRYSLKYPEPFEAQIAGLLRAATRGRLRIMLPMVSSIDELRAAKEIMQQVARRLLREGKDHRADVPMGIMVEVPSTAMMADLFARECDFFAIGTNDLLQYLLAIDRTNERVDYLYRPLAPSVLRTLRMICTAAGEAGIAVSVCGEMAGDPQHTAVFLALNVQQLSMNAYAIPRVKRLVRELRKSDCDELLADALGCATHDEVNGLVQRFLNDRSSLRIEAAAESQND